MSYILGTQTTPATLAQAQSVTWANRPSTAVTGEERFVSNAGTKGSKFYFDGTIWKPVNGMCLLASQDTAGSNIPNSETVVFQYQIPAGLWQVGFVLAIDLTVTKSGTTDSGTIKIRIGTAGTTADTQIVSLTPLGAANQQWQGRGFIRLDSTTTALMLPGASSGFAQGTANGALAAAVSISDASSNALFVNATLASSSTNDTVAIRSGQIWLIAKAN